MAIARFPSIVIDCPDPAALAAFYGTMLDWTVSARPSAPGGTSISRGRPSGCSYPAGHPFCLCHD